jgi:hypothetical protein
MARKKADQQKSPSPQRKEWHKRRRLMASALILSLGIAGIALAQWRSFRRVFNPLSPAPQASQTPQLAKEYIYAGGRLVALEQPVSGGTSALSAPSSLTATGSAIPSTQVNLNWTASTGGTVASYQVERMQNVASGYTVVASNVTTTNYNDTTVSAGSAYLYRIRAMDTSNNFSSYSSFDLATAMTFNDDPLISYPQDTSDPNTATTIKAAHITQLRTAVNAVRALANLPAATWSNPVQATATIFGPDITELRSSLAQALTALGLQTPSYTYPTITAQVSIIHKADIKELRDAVK